MEKIELIYGCTPKKDHARIKATLKASISEILERHIPGVSVKYWGGGQSVNLTPSIQRLYFSRGGADLGYIEMRIAPRAARGRYEAHRAAKGEQAASESWSETLPAEISTAFAAAFAEYADRTGQEWKIEAKDFFHIADLAI